MDGLQNSMRDPLKVSIFIKNQIFLFSIFELNQLIHLGIHKIYSTPSIFFQIENYIFIISRALL
jgi:hypothetical protein